MLGCLPSGALSRVNALLLADSFYSRWRALNDWLVQHQAIWKPAPFMEPVPGWVQSYPELVQLLMGLSDAECAELDGEPAKLASMASQYLPELALYANLVDVPELAPEPADVLEATLPEIRARDMPGRKREQAGAFTAVLKPLQQPILDWCCGKGHLSRTLAAQSQNLVKGYEWNSKLVADGNRLAAHFGDSVQIHCQDVMVPHVPLPDGTHIAALHACGDLHRQLLIQGAAAELPRLSLSPCCYHKTADGLYKPLSERATTHGERLELNRDDMRLAVRETVTAPTGVREQTATLSQWRLGFDGLQRSLRGVDEYLPVPPYSPKLIHQGFAGFCHWAAGKKQLILPALTDFDSWLAHGVQRQKDVRRYELIRHIFRRPLELWLVLDYAVFLEEQGYRVRLGRFCSRSLTPRNLLLDAAKKKGARERLS